MIVELNAPLPLLGSSKQSLPRSVSRAILLSHLSTVHSHNNTDNKLLIVLTETCHDLRLPTPLKLKEDESTLKKQNKTKHSSSSPSAPLCRRPLKSQSPLTLLRRLSITTTSSAPLLPPQLASQYDVIGFTPHTPSSLASVVAVPNSIVTLDYSFKSSKPDVNNGFCCPVKVTSDLLKLAASSSTSFEICYGPAIASPSLVPSFVSAVSSFYTAYSSLQHKSQRPLVVLSAGTASVAGIVSRPDAGNYVAAVCGLPASVAREWMSAGERVLEEILEGGGERRGVKKGKRKKKGKGRGKRESENGGGGDGERFDIARDGSDEEEEGEERRGEESEEEKEGGNIAGGSGEAQKNKKAKKAAELREEPQGLEDGFLSLQNVADSDDDESDSD